MRSRRFLVLIVVAGIVGVVVVAGRVVLSRADLSAPARALHAPAERARLHPRSAAVVAAARARRLRACSWRWRSRACPARAGTFRRTDSRWAAGSRRPIDLPGVILAGLATIGSGLVLGPEAPLIALGVGRGAAHDPAARRDTPQQALLVIAAAGSFAAISFIFDSPLIAAVHADRGDRDRRSAAADDPGPRPARRRHRLAGLDRDGLVHGPEHQRLRARPLCSCRPSATRRSRSSPGRSRWRSRSRCGTVA